jgi:hypothetical protein
MDFGLVDLDQDTELLQAGPLGQYSTVTVFPLLDTGHADLFGSAQLDEQEMDG